MTEKLVDELNKETSEIRYRRVLDISDGGRPRGSNIADLDGLEPESKAAYAISHLVGSGAFERLRQCQDNACDRFSWVLRTRSDAQNVAAPAPEAESRENAIVIQAYCLVPETPRASKSLTIDS